MKMERKLMVVGCCILLVSIGLSALATRTITDTSDTVYSGIICSNGNTYTATAANIQAAINSLNNSKGGWVKGSYGKITTAATISIWENVSVDLNYMEIVPTGDYDVFRVFRKSTFENAFINISGDAAFSNSSACVRIYGSYGSWETFDSERQRTIRNIHIMGDGVGANKQRGIGLLLQPSAACNSPSLETYENIYARYINCTVKAVVNTAQYVNFNTFRNIKGVGCAYHIWLLDSANEISMNNFDDIRYEAESITNEHYPIYIQGNCDWNTFSKIGIMDWLASGDTKDMIYINSATASKNQFQGAISIALGGITDLGSSNSFLSYDILKIYDVNASNIARDIGSTTGVKFYETSSANPYTYFYGYTVGGMKYGILRTESTGNFLIASTLLSDIILRPGGSGGSDPGTRNVTIDDILKLHPRTTTPTGATAGMIYYNGTTNLLMLYTTGWHSINIT